MARTRTGRARTAGPAEPQQIRWASDKQRSGFEYGPVGLGDGLGGPLMLSGGYGSAKTWLICMKILWLMSTFPGYRVVMFRRVWAELQRTTMSTFFKLCPTEAYEGAGPNGATGRSDSQKIVRFANRSELLWMHMDDPEVEGVIRGIETNAFAGDQMEEIEEEIFDHMMGRLGRWDQAKVPQALLDANQPWPFLDRLGRPIPPTFALGTCNPDTELHWIYRRFHPESVEHAMKRDMVRFDPDTRALTHFESSYKQEGYRMITMASWENRFLPAVNLNELLKKDESFRRRYVEGEWGIPEGQIHHIDEASYLDWTPELIGWIQAACYLYRGLDHGDAAPTCCLWMAVTEDGDLIVYREYYQPNELISTHRVRITELSAGERYRGSYADPSIFHKTMQKYGGRWSVADEYMDTKVLRADTSLFWMAADNNELGTRNRINEFLMRSGSGRFEMVDGSRTELPRPHPVTKEMGFWPRMFFVRKSEHYTHGCDHVIRQTKSQRREKVGVEDGKPIFGDDRDAKIADHAYDCLRYLTATRPSVPSTLLPQYSEKTFRGKRAMMIRMKKRGKMMRSGAA